MAHDLISIIVPTRNSVKKISHLLKSLSESTDSNFELIVVDSVDSSDYMDELCSKYSSNFKIHYFKKYKYLPQARNSGAAHAKGSILLNLDSDMSVSKSLLGECRELIHSGFDALIIPEFAIGNSYWSKIKAIEKNMYQGQREIEGIRCVSSELFSNLNGYNEELFFSEDKDFDLRAQKFGAKIGRTQSSLIHYEGRASLKELLSKKIVYAKSAFKYKKIHAESFAWQKNPLNRFVIFWEKRKISNSVHQLISLYILKILEYVFSFIAYNYLQSNYLKTANQLKTTVPHLRKSVGKNLLDL